MDDLRLMLVDDETGFCRTLGRRLRKRGWRVEEANDGAYCLSLLRKSPFDIVISDVKMPGMNGLELLQKIKEEHPDTEVMLLTGNATISDGVDGIKSGAFDYLTKPVELDHLLGKLGQIEDRIRHREEMRREKEYRKNMEKRMAAAERLASLGTLAAGVAHEINNPLAIIGDAAGWMKLIISDKDAAGIPRRDDLAKAVSKIEKAVRRAARITHQMLGFVREKEPEIQEVDLDVLVDESFRLISGDAKHKEIQLSSEGAEDGNMIRTDPYQLRQVLLNLLNNAVHATGKGGTIRVRIRKTGESALITVADTGHGIPEELKEKIFDPFFTTKEPGKGTGLGLYVSRCILEKLGGIMDIESRVGEGTEFVITLPLKWDRKSGKETEEDNRQEIFDCFVKK